MVYTEKKKTDSEWDSKTKIWTDADKKKIVIHQQLFVSTWGGCVEAFQVYY